MALAVDGKAETARQQAFAPAAPTPTIAMSLDQPVTIALPTHILEAEPISPATTQRSTEGENAPELTPNTALVQPITDLTLPENVSDSEAMMTAVSPRRKASASTENDETASETARERSRRSSARSRSLKLSEAC